MRFGQHIHRPADAGPHTGPRRAPQLRQRLRLGQRVVAARVDERVQFIQLPLRHIGVRKLAWLGRYDGVKLPLQQPREQAALIGRAHVQ
ncbi:hypothetical protein D3C71_1803470 [compost metagenome]